MWSDGWTARWRLFRHAEGPLGNPRFRWSHASAYSNKHEPERPVIKTTREEFPHSLTIAAIPSSTWPRRASRADAGGREPESRLTIQGSNRVRRLTTVMGVAKAALESSVRYLANDLGPQAIRVNAISPGADEDAGGRGHRGGARKTFKTTEANAPLRANATLEAVGGTAVYLCSDYGACTTGEIVTVDGGLSRSGHASARESLSGRCVGGRGDERGAERPPPISSICCAKFETLYRHGSAGGSTAIPQPPQARAGRAVADLRVQPALRSARGQREARHRASVAGAGPGRTGLHAGHGPRVARKSATR